MGKQKETGISWCDFTFNPWIGCQKVSPACKHCYAEELTNRFGGDFSGTRKLTSDAYWREPSKWNREAEGASERPRVFCASLADVFEDWNGPIVDHRGGRLRVSPVGAWVSAGPLGSETDMQRMSDDFCDVTMNDVRQRLFALIDATPNLDWLLLTKRPENIKRMINIIRLDGGTTGRIPEFDIDTPAHPYFRRNVWLGTTCENQEQADKRIPELLKCRDLSPVLFLSCEPLLGPVDLTKVEVPEHADRLRRPWDIEGYKFNALQEHDEDRFHQGPATINWVIVGGESGPNARPTHPEWARSLRDQCQAAGVAFHFKQWGEYVPGDHDSVKFGDDHKTTLPWHSPDFGNDLTPMVRVGKSRAGRLLDGREWNEVPHVKK